MDSLNRWLSHDVNRKDIPMDQLNIILSELHERVIGIRGSNVFTVTYCVLWNVHMLNYLILYLHITSIDFKSTVF